MALFKGLTGMEWPQADEDGLRLVAGQYHSAAAMCPQMAELFTQVVHGVSADFEGAAADAFVTRMKDFVGGDRDYLRAAAVQAGQLGEFAHYIANQVEYAKWMIIAQLIQLLVEIAIAVALGVFGGPMWAQVAINEVLTREFIVNVMKFLVRTIAMHTAIGVSTAGAMDWIIQGIQIAEGNRERRDTGLTLQALEFGAIAGVISGPVGVLAAGAGKVVGNVFGRGLRSALADGLGDALGRGVGRDVSEVGAAAAGGGGV